MTKFKLQTLYPLFQSLDAAFGIVAVLCYGSFAQGCADEKSDIDLLIICKKAIPEPLLRKQIYDEYKVEDLQLEKSFGEWEPVWTPSNDEFSFQGQKVEIGYNTLAWVENLLEEVVEKGKIKLKDFSFRPYTFFGLLDNALCLYENEAYFSKWKKTIQPFPRKLQQAIIAENLPIFKDNLADLENISQRNIGVLAFEFYLFRAMEAAIQILFAMNGAYDPASKRTENFLLKLPNLPKNLPSFIEEILPVFFTKKEEVVKNLKEMKAFFEKTW